jgi:WD40 repeat protein
VRQVTFLPDGKTIAATSALGTLNWTIGSDKPPQRVALPSSPTALVAVSPDGKTMAAARPLGGIDVWDATTGKAIRKVDATEPVRSLALSSDGKALAWGTEDGARLLLLKDETPRQLGRERDTVTGLAFSADGKLLAIAQSDGIQLWDVAKGENVRALSGYPAPRMEILAFDPQGRVLASSAGQEGSDTVTLYDVVSGTELHHCRRDGARIHSLAFARGGRLLITGEEDGLTFWETASGSEVLHLRGHSGAVNALAISPDGTRLASGSADLTVLLWDLAAAWKETAPEEKKPSGLTELSRNLQRDAATAYRALWALAAERDKACRS